MFKIQKSFDSNDLGGWFERIIAKRFVTNMGGAYEKTGGKVKSSQTRKGKNRAAGALRMAAWSLMRSKSYLGAYLRRQRARLGAPKAITATAHKLARIVYNVMRYGVAYMQQTEAAYAEQVNARLEKQLRRRAKELGFELKKIETPTEPTVETTAAPTVETPQVEAAQTKSK